MKKDKDIAGVLALLFGWFGAHRFYLGQERSGVFTAVFALLTLGAWKLPVVKVVAVVVLFPILILVGLIDAIRLFSMSKTEFDEKYNPGLAAQSKVQPQPAKKMSRHKRRKLLQALKASGKKKFLDYDYEGAIADFQLSLDIAPNDITSHFNLACAYSLTEKTEQAFFHLEQAVKQGFQDVETIKSHHALAFLRIQPQFAAFVENGYRRPGPQPQEKAAPAAPEDLLHTQPSLLDQLKKLGDLRKRGFLTEKEFEKRKRELLA